MNSTTTRQVFAIDPAHTTAEFIVRHMMIAKVRGRFTGIAGTFEATDGGRTLTGVQATMDVASIATGEPQRDAHLKSPDFFDLEKFPKIEFTSTKIVSDGGNEFEIHGDLTIHGTTRPLVLKATFEGRSTDPYGNQRVGYEAVGKLSRGDFGLTWNQALETGGVVVGDEVKIELTVEGIAQP